ncbi:hypothetical protein [Parasphingorhabdus sp.]|uniref:hypothetical protein n=1 Tax=Parasphingorhabdus sp. TaxID=2709688 RepID=UPI003A91CC47
MSGIALLSPCRCEVRCEPQIEIVLRTINMFAKRGFHPDDIRISRNAEDYCVQIAVSELDPHTASIIFEGIRAMPLIHSVRRTARKRDNGRGAVLG